MLLAVAHAGQQSATTKDGREVVLKEDGTWEYAEGALKNPGKPEVRLPVTKTAEGFTVTLLGIRRQKNFASLPQEEGREFVVISFLIDRQPEKRLWNERLMDANGNVIAKAGGLHTTDGPVYAFAVPEGCQVKAFRIGPIEFDLTAVKIPSLP